MSATRTKARSRNARSQGLPLFSIVMATIVVLGAIGIVATIAGTDEEVADETRPVTLTGKDLPRMVEQGQPDPAIGLQIPEIKGEDFDGKTVTIKRDGRAKIVAFVAHWCHVCQAEVPRLSDYVKNTGMPDNVDLYFVSTDARRGAGNYPPSEWLAREGLGDVPTVADDATSKALASVGGTSFPLIVYIDADGKVALRTVGEVPDATFAGYVDALAKGEALAAN